MQFFPKIVFYFSRSFFYDVIKDLFNCNKFVTH